MQNFWPAGPNVLLTFSHFMMTDCKGQKLSLLIDKNKSIYNAYNLPILNKNKSIKIELADGLFTMKIRIL